jgi:hypothetical protein
MEDVYRILPYASQKISVSYDSSQHPYFGVIVSESLSRVASRPVGKRLLDEIGSCTPEARFGGQDEHVKIMPTFVNATFQMRGAGSGDWQAAMIEEKFMERQRLREQLLAFPNRNTELLKNLLPSGVWGNDFLLTTGAGNCHASEDAVAGENGTGSVSTVFFSNAKRALSSGVTAPPFIGLAHELIHALHGLRGEKLQTTRDGGPEELRTVGLGDFTDEPVTENKIRAEHGVMIRSTY